MSFSERDGSRYFSRQYTDPCQKVSANQTAGIKLARPVKCVRCNQDSPPPQPSSYTVSRLSLHGLRPVAHLDAVRPHFFQLLPRTFQLWQLSFQLKKQSQVSLKNCCLTITEKKLLLWSDNEGDVNTLEQLNHRWGDNESDKAPLHRLIIMKNSPYNGCC